MQNNKPQNFSGRYLIKSLSMLVLIPMFIWSVFTVSLSDFAEAFSPGNDVVGGYDPMYPLMDEVLESGSQPVFFRTIPYIQSAVDSQSYQTTVFTFDDMAVFSYFDETEIKVFNSEGTEVHSEVLNANSYASVSVSRGVYRIIGSKSYTVLVGDALTGSVQGFFAVDEGGRGASTLLNTYMPRGSYSNERFIVFAYQDNTSFTIKNLDTDTILNAGVLNEGEHFTMPSAPFSTFIQVTANRPVSALSYLDQDYYVPSSNGTFTGEKFYGYSAYIGNWTNSIAVTAYQDDTEVEVANSQTGEVITSYTLDEGQVGAWPIQQETYWTVTSSKPVTAANIPFAGWTGSYAYLTRAIDQTGTGAGNLFYVPTIASRLDVFSLDDNNEVTVVRLGLYDSYPYTDPVERYSGVLNSGESINLNTETGRYVYKVTGSGRVSIIQSNSGAGADFMTPGYVYDLPDLAISSSDIVFSPEDDEYVTGDTVTAAITVHNYGPVGAENILVHAYDGDPDSATSPLIAERTISSIAAYSSGQTSFEFRVPRNPEFHNLVVKVDPYNEIAESNSSNNKAARPLRPNRDLQLPLVVTISAPGGLEINQSSELEPNPFKVTANIFNNSEISAFDVSVVINTLDGLSLSDGNETTEFEIILSNESKEIVWWLEADPANSGSNRYEITVDAQNAEEKVVKRAVNVPDLVAPSAPTGLSGRRMDENGVELTWNANTESDLAGYRIYYGEASGDYSGKGADQGDSPIVISSFTSFTITGLHETKPYFYAITAFDTSENESDFSDEIEIGIAEEYTVSVSADPEAGGTVTGAGTYQNGQSVTVTAIANAGYVFKNWTEAGNEVSTESSYDFTVSSDRTLVAYFEESLPPGPCAAAYLLGEDDPRLDILRQFRDDNLSGSDTGKEMISLYYDKSDEIIAICERNPFAKWSFKAMLETLITVVEVLR